MVRKVSMADILALSVDERIQLAQDIWDSLAVLPESVTLTDAQRKELDSRLDAYRQDPNSGSPWEQVRDSLRNPG